MLRSLFNLLYPIYCIGCQKGGSGYICAQCHRQIKSHPEICPICHKFSPGYQVCLGCYKKTTLRGLIIGFQYHHIIKKAILMIKYYHIYDITHFLSRKLDLLIKTNPILQDDIKKGSKCILTFVPSHRTRKYFIKGYNQSELLAQELSKISTYEVVPITKKIKYTTSQAKLNRAKRIINLIGAFKINSQYQLHGDETIIIVDDVTTTGSTLQEIAKNITNIYPHTKIWGCVIARNMN